MTSWLENTVKNTVKMNVNDLFLRWVFSLPWSMHLCVGPAADGDGMAGVIQQGVQLHPKT